MHKKGNRQKKLNIGMLLSIGIVLVALFVVIPFLLDKSVHPILGGIGVLVLVPLLPTISSILQGDLQANVVNFTREYLLHTFDLLFQLTFILLILPIIAFSIIMILIGVMIFALGAGIILWVFQSITTIDIGIGVSGEDIFYYAKLLIALSLVEGVLYLIQRKANQYEGGFFGLIDALEERIVKLIRTTFS